MADAASLSRRELLRAGAGLALAGPGLLAAGCGGDDAPKPPGTKRIGLSLAGSYPFARCLASGAYAAVAGSGYDLVVVDAGFAAARETENITRLIERRVDGLIIQPVSVETATRGAQFAQQAGIRVSTTMSPGPGPGSKFFAGVVEVPGVQGGRLIGRWLRENVPRGGEIIVVQGILGRGVSELLDQGLDLELAGAPRFEVVRRGPGNLDRREAVTVVREGFALYPKASIVVDYGAVMGDAIAAYLRERGRDDVVHVTSDADESTARWLRTPYLRATRYFSAARTGREATDIVLDALRDGRGAVDPFTRTVPQSMRDARTIAAAEPFCDERFARQVARI